MTPTRARPAPDVRSICRRREAAGKRATLRYACASDVLAFPFSCCTSAPSGAADRAGVWDWDYARFPLASELFAFS